MSEPAPELAADPIEAIPAADSGDFGDYSFEQALESSLNEAEAPPVKEPTEEKAPAKEEVQEEKTEGTSETATETTTETEATEEATEEVAETSDLLESIESDVGEDWTPKASAAFQKLKANNKTLISEREQLTQRAREAEAKVAELEGVVGNATVETLQQRVAEYENAQMVSNLESTQAYNNAVIKPLEEIFIGVEKLAETHGVDYQALVDAITIEDSHQQEEKVSELLATASDREKATFYRLAADIDPILQRRDALRLNAAEALKEADLAAEEDSKKQAAAKASERVSVTNNVAQRITDKVPFLSEFEGLDMSSVSKEAASVDPTVVHPVDFAYQAVAARLIPPLIKEYASSQKLIDELTKQLATYENAEPKLSGGSSPSSLASSSGGDTNFAASIEAALAGS